jgi:transcription antitermination protein NusB
MGLRHLGRELALKALYQADIVGRTGPEGIHAALAAMPAHERAREFAEELATGVVRERALLDEMLASVLEHWSLGRLSRIDHNVLRLALYELLRFPDVPMKVAIDEAIELAKRYGDQESGRFVNGVLDSLAGRLGLKKNTESSGSTAKLE